MLALIDTRGRGFSFTARDGFNTNRTNRNHTTIRFAHNTGFPFNNGRQLVQIHFGLLCVSLSDLPSGFRCNVNTIVLLQFRADLRKGMISTKVTDNTL